MNKIFAYAVCALIPLAGITSAVGSKNVYYGGKVAMDSVAASIESRIPSEAKLAVVKKQLADKKASLQDSDRLQAELDVKSEHQATKVATIEMRCARDKRRMTILRSQLPGGDSTTKLVSTDAQSRLARELAAGLKAYASDSDLLGAEQNQLVELNRQRETLALAVSDRRRLLDSLEKSIAILEGRLQTVKIRNGGSSLPSADGLYDVEVMLASIKETVDVEERLQANREAGRSLEFVDEADLLMTSEAAANEFDAIFGEIVAATAPCKG